MLTCHRRCRKLTLGCQGRIGDSDYAARKKFSNGSAKGRSDISKVCTSSKVSSRARTGVNPGPFAKYLKAHRKGQYIITGSQWHCAPGVLPMADGYTSVIARAPEMYLLMTVWSGGRLMFNAALARA